MHGKSLAGLALRTRSKIVKELVCEALGYPTPKSFKKVQPRFLGQLLDTYAQKALNLQIWNEELSPNRRYALIQVLEGDIIGRIKVVDGQELAKLDTTGTITKKYQARLDIGSVTQELFSLRDTEPMWIHLSSQQNNNASTSPIKEPMSGELLPIKDIFDKLSTLVGTEFNDPGIDQERNRGAALHRLVCEKLGDSRYEDKGQFPDIRHQLLEVKLQTSPTIDLGLIQPNSEIPLDVNSTASINARHCDTRYAIFCAKTDGVKVTLTHLYLITGLDFYSRFKRFEGKVANGKIQIPLPSNFFQI